MFASEKLAAAAGVPSVEAVAESHRWIRWLAGLIVMVGREDCLEHMMNTFDFPMYNNQHNACVCVCDIVFVRLLIAYLQMPKNLLNGSSYIYTYIQYL